MTSTSDINNALADPELLSRICGDVAVGGTLVQYCHEHAINYKAVNRWLFDDEKRAEAYRTALIIREEHAKDLIIAELIAWIKADLTTCFDEEGNMKSMHEMGPNERKLISGWKFRELFEHQDDEEAERGSRGGIRRKRVHVGNIIEVKLWDKGRSIETFMKHLAMLVDRKQIDVSKSLADLISESMKLPTNQEKPDV